MTNEPTSTTRARRLRERRSRGGIMVAPVEIGKGGVELLVDNGLLKQHQRMTVMQSGKRHSRPLSSGVVPRPGGRVRPSDKDRQLLLKTQPRERKDLIGESN